MRRRINRIGWLGWGRACIALAALLATNGTLRGQVPGRSFPSNDYYSALQVFLDGDVVRAARGFDRMSRMKTLNAEWVDSIARHAMLGECKYQMGDLGGALDQYTAALNIYLANPAWLLGLELPPRLAADTRSTRSLPTWGPGARPIRMARMPAHIQSRQGNSAEQNLRALRQGGVVAQPYYVLIDVAEIIRCTALAIRRRAEILGPVAGFDEINSRVITALSARPAPAGHWTQAWISAMLGSAYAGGGDVEQAVGELKRSVLAGGLDHNLTSTSLLELGKLAFATGKFAQAAIFFQDASLAAGAAAYDDAWQYEVVGEAMRWGLSTHLALGRTGVYGPLGPATVWAHRFGPQTLESSLMLLSAEGLSAGGDYQKASALLDQALRGLRRREIVRGRVGVRIQFVRAQAAVQKGDAASGASALVDVMKFQRSASTRLFQIAVTDRLVASNTVTSRQAVLLYAEVLRDPRAADWMEDPLESLSVLSIPHPAPYQHWIDLVVARKEIDSALRISDQLRRHRFYSTLPLGGRVLNLRWMLEGPVESLPADVVLQRQAFLARHQGYARLSGQAAQLRRALRELQPENAGEPERDEKLRQQSELATQLAQIGRQQEQVLAAVALSREASLPVFPPTTDPTVVQEQLEDGQRALVYVATEQAVYAFMLGGEKYSSWRLEAASQVRAAIPKLLREMGHYDRNQELSAGDLKNDEWKKTSAEILKAVTADAPATAWDEFDELIFIPDGTLWYLPMQALQIEEGDRYVSVIDKVRVRYAPTISLAVPGSVPRVRVGRTALALGRLHPKGEASEATELLDDLRAEDATIFQIPEKPLPLSSSLITSYDRLLVLRDLTNDTSGPYDWAPLDLDRNRRDGTLHSWMALPWGGPQQLLLPGFHTPAENGLKRGGTGNDLFLTACGLMASGSRTVMLSRWRDGGHTTHELMREFLRELPHRSAAGAWQRSVRLATAADLDLAREPRLNSTGTDTALKAEHPFFWGGYVLIDTGSAPATEE